MGPSFFMRLAALILLALAPVVAQAHTFGHLYTLPVPLWLYAWGAAAALVLSFLVAGFFMGEVAAPSRGVDIPLGDSPAVQALRRARALELARLGSAAMLLLTIATGLAGNRDPLRNFSMTAFWVVFLLGMTYLTALAGNVYAALNPWRALTGALARLVPRYEQGRVKYPVALNAWPALALFLALVAFELTVRGTPFSLGAALALYTLLNIAGVWLGGSPAWFEHCELFSVYFRNVALLAPLAYRPAAPGAGSLTLRWPGAGALEARPLPLAGVIFVLAMLAATAYDGLRETRPWSGLFWQDPLGVFTSLAGAQPITDVEVAMPWYRAWDALWLLAAPFLYFAAYVLAIALVRAAARSQRPLRELLLDFAYTLLPIVLAYHAAHYFTLLIDQGPKILSLVSDPFGIGWDLFGTTQRFRAATLPDLTWVWHVQVLLILGGHVWSVLLAHRVALRVFPTRARALASQLPMLALMVSFTVFGLWILAQPLTSTIVRS